MHVEHPIRSRHATAMHSVILLTSVAVLIAFVLASAAIDAMAGVRGSSYRSLGRCGPYLRAVVTTPKWACLGIVAGAMDGLKMPRAILEWQPGRFIITDMGSWSAGEGRVLLMETSVDGTVAFRTLFDGLDLPHGLSRGPDAKIYIGESGRIWRFDPGDVEASREVVLDNLPNTGLHRLKHFVFDKDGNLIVNFGAPSDRCEAPGSPTVQVPCPEAEGKRPEAALWLATFDKPGGKVKGLTPLAQGLRNSMALAVHPKSGLILQAENSIDLAPENAPPEELNVIRKGRHYGWPYCTGRGDRVPGLAKRVSCGRYEEPALLMPAHSAPLGMLYYSGAMFPELRQKLVVALHGYRDNGHRLIAYDTSKSGRPLRPAKPFATVLIDDWTATPDLRPRGAPVGLTVAGDGSLWLVEDRNRTVMVLLRNTGDAKANEQPLEDDGPSPAVGKPAAASPPTAWGAFYERVLHARCSQCHLDFRTSSPEIAWQALAGLGWLDGGTVKDWKLIKVLRGDGGLKPMPPPKGLSTHPADIAALERFLADTP